MFHGHLVPRGFPMRIAGCPSSSMGRAFMRGIQRLIRPTGLWSKRMRKPEIDGVLELAIHVSLCLRRHASSVLSLRVSSRRRTACHSQNYTSGFSSHAVNRTSFPETYLDLEWFYSSISGSRVLLGVPSLVPTRASLPATSYRAMLEHLHTWFRRFASNIW